MEIDIVNTCNLSCKHCARFTEMYHSNPYSIEEFTKDVNKLSTVLHTEFSYLMGGEATILGDKLLTYIDILKKSGLCGGVGLMTNGILLLKKEHLINAFDFIQLSIYKTKYYDDLMKFLMGDDLPTFLPNGNFMSTKFPHIEVMPRETFFKIFDPDRPILTNEESDMIFKNCRVNEFCNVLYKGRYYRCGMTAKVWPLLDKHNVKYTINPKEMGVDLYQPDLENKLKSYLFGGVKDPACSYCWCSGDYAKPVLWEEYQ